MKKTEKNKSKEIKKSDKQYFFVSGLPRAGSTLLENILAQNPRFHATATSGIMDVMFSVRNNWSQMIEFQASPNDEGLIRVLRSILESYYADIDKPVIFDKSRGWLSQIEMAEEVLGHNVKIIAPVRDLRDVVASFEKLWRENAPYQQLAQERANYFDFQTMQGRVNVWLRADQPVGLAYNRLVDAYKRGYADRILLVDFDDLTSKPDETMRIIYDFLGEEYFDHDFKNVKQVTTENDAVHGIRNLHKIRSRVEPIKPRWPEILGMEFDTLKQMNFWKKTQ
jgi:sulfotransferase